MHKNINLLIIFVLFVGCSGKLKKENKLLKEKNTKQNITLLEIRGKLEKLELQITILKDEKNSLTTEVENLRADSKNLKEKTKRLEEVENELALLKESDKSYYEEALVAYNLSQKSMRSNDLKEAKNKFSSLIQKFPHSKYNQKADELIKDLSNKIAIAGPITNGEKKISEALKKNEFNNAYYELNKIKDLLSTKRFNKNRAKIEKALKTPIVFDNYQDFYDSSISGLWIGAKYKVDVKIDKKGKRICDPNLKGCSFKQSVKIRTKMSKKRKKLFKKTYGSKACLSLYMHKKWIYIYNFSKKTCPIKTDKMLL